MGWSRRGRMHGVDGEMITEKELQDITEKYAYYMEHSYTDIVWSKSGKAYFIEFDKNGECNSFYIAEQSDELERIIKMSILENMECIIEVAAEEANYQLQRYDMSNIELGSQTDYENRLQILVDKLEIIYASLKNIYQELIK